MSVRVAYKSACAYVILLVWEGGWGSGVEVWNQLCPYKDMQNTWASIKCNAFWKYTELLKIRLIFV